MKEYSAASARNIEMDIEQIKDAADRDIANAARQLAFTALVAAVRNTSGKEAPALVTPDLLRAWLIHRIDAMKVESMAAALDMDVPQDKELGDRETRLRMHIRACDGADLYRALVITMIRGDDRHGYYGATPTNAQLFSPLAKHLGVDLDALKAQATSAVKAVTAEKIKQLKAELKPAKPPKTTAPLAPPPTLPAARLNPLPGQGKQKFLRALKLAKQQAELQKLDADPASTEAPRFGVGTRVRVLDAAALRPVMALFAAKEGSVHGLDISEGHDLWIVALDGRKGRTGGNRKFLTEELETIS